MKKRKAILSMLLALLMVCNLIVPISAEAAPQLTVTADKKYFNKAEGTANIIYTISLNPNGNKIGAFQFKLQAPDGMTLSTESAEEQGADGYWINAAGLQYVNMPGFKNNPFTTFDYERSTGSFGASGGVEGRTLDTPATIMTIKATVAINAVKNYSLNVSEFVCFAVDGKTSLGGDTPTVDTVTVGKPAISTVSATVADPVKNTVLDDSVNVPTGAEYTATVQWFKGENATGTSVTGDAEAGTVYTAKITVKANSGSTFATSVTGPTGYTLDRVDAETLTLTKTFDATSNKDPLAGTVTITGTPKVGQTLTANLTGSNETDSNKLTYQWYRNGEVISGATNNTYAVTKDDIGAAIKVRVTANDDSEVAGYLESAATVAVTCGHPSKQHVDAKAKTCTENGNSEYWTCPDCGKWFSDETCTTVISDHDSVIIPKGHTWAATWSHDDKQHWKACTANGCEARNQIEDHSGGTATCAAQATCSVCKQPYGEKDMSNHVGELTYANATNPGKHQVTCDACNTSSEEAHYTKNPDNFATCVHGNICDKCGGEFGSKAAHKLTPHAANPATCTTAGTLAYYECGVCHKKFSDTTCAKELTDINVPVNSNAHKLTLVPATDSTCTTHGHEAYYKCDYCSKMFNKNTDDKAELNAVPEKTLAAHTGGTATCTEQAECSVCHQKYGDLAAHTYTKGQYKTVEPKGSIKVERLICDVCGKEATEGDNAYRASISLDMILKVVKASDGTNAVPAGKVFGYTITTEPTIAGLPTAFNFAATKGGDETITQAHLFACSNAEEAKAISALKDLLMDGGKRTWTIQQQTTASADGWTVDGTVYTLKFAITDGNVVTPTITKVVKETKTEIDPATNKVQSIEFTNTYKSTSTTPGGNGGTGGGFPFKDSNKTNNTGKVESQKTFDGGIALYVGLSVLSLTGSALVIRKKKEF